MAVQLSSIRPLKVFVFLPLKSSDSYPVSNNITQRISSEISTVVSAFLVIVGFISRNIRNKDVRSVILSLF